MLLVSVSHFVDSQDETLTVIKPVSIKLQKKYNDIVKAYNMMAETGKELRQMRNNANTVFKAWYANAIDLGSDPGTKPSVPRTALRQRHRENTPHDSPEEYYRQTLFIPFLDHIPEEMSSR